MAVPCLLPGAGSFTRVPGACADGKCSSCRCPQPVTRAGWEIPCPWLVAHTLRVIMPSHARACARARAHTHTHTARL